MKRTPDRRAIALGAAAALFLLACGVAVTGLQAAEEKRIVDVIAVSDAITAIVPS